MVAFQLASRALPEQVFRFFRAVRPSGLPARHGQCAEDLRSSTFTEAYPLLARGAGCSGVQALLAKPVAIRRACTDFGRVGAGTGSRAAPGRRASPRDSPRS